MPKAERKAAEARRLIEDELIAELGIAERLTKAPHR